MVKRLLTVLFASVLVFSLSAPSVAQDAKAKPKKQDRWEGMVTIVSKDKTSFVVRKQGTNEEKSVTWDSSTEWSSQEHGSKKINMIDASQVKEGDRVICVGSFGKDGVLIATRISKRLTQRATVP